MAKVWTRSFFCHCLRSHTWWHSEKLLSQVDMDQGPDSYSLTWCWKSFSIEELIHCLPFCFGTLIAAISVKVLLYNFYASVKKLSASQHTGDQTFTMSRYFRLTPSLALAMCLGRQAYAAYAALQHAACAWMHEMIVFGCCSTASARLVYYGILPYLAFGPFAATLQDSIFRRCDGFRPQ